MPTKQEEKTGFTFNAEDSPKDSPISKTKSDQTKKKSSVEDKPYKWSAPDSFTSKKNLKWYLALVVIAFVLSALIYLVTKDKITVAVVLVCAVLIAFYASKKPEMVKYEINWQGFSINGRQYGFNEYRSFSVLDHGIGRSVVLRPLKRFMPYMYIGYRPEDEKKVLDTLSNELPETTHTDSVDKIFRAIGF